MAEPDAETVKIVIEVVDKFSKPLEDLKRSLQGFDKGGEGATRIKGAFDLLRVSVLDTTKVIQAGIVPALRAFGIGAISVSAGITGMIVALRSFGGSIDVLSRLSRETGFTIDKMKEWEAIGRRVGVSAADTQRGFRDFHENIRLLRLGLGNLAEFQKMGLGREALAISRMTDSAQQLAEAIAIADRIREPAHKRAWLEGWGLPPNWADLARAEREKAAAEWRKTATPITAAGQEAAKRFEDKIWEIGNAWAGLMDRMAEGGTLKALTELLDEFRKLLTDPNFGKELTKGFDDLARVMRDLVGFAKWVIDTIASGKKLLGGRSFDPNDPHMRAPGALTDEEFIKRQNQNQEKSSGWDWLKGLFREGTSEGVVEGLKKMSLDMPGGGAAGTAGGGSFGGASVIRASLGSSSSRSGGYSGSSSDVSTPMGDPLDRSRFAEELKAKPWLREKILGIAAGENMDPRANTAVMESMMNRAAARGTSLEEAAKLYGKETGGYYAGYNPGALRNAKTRAMIEGNLDKVLGGSNVSNYATDNASAGLAARNKATGRFRLQSEYGGESFFSPGTAGGGRSSRQRYEAWRNSIKPSEPPPSSSSSPAEHPAVPRGKLMDASIGATQSARIEGSASVRIDLASAPGRGGGSPGRGVFSNVALHRGDTLPLASESA